MAPFFAAVKARLTPLACTVHPVLFLPGFTLAVLCKLTAFARIDVLNAPLALQMVLAPQQSVTKRLMSSDLLFVPLALMYLYLLVHSWEPDMLRLILPGSLADGLKGTRCACLEPWLG